MNLWKKGMQNRKGRIRDANPIARSGTIGSLALLLANMTRMKGSTTSARGKRFSTNNEFPTNSSFKEQLV